MCVRPVDSEWHAADRVQPPNAQSCLSSTEPIQLPQGAATRQCRSAGKTPSGARSLPFRVTQRAAPGAASTSSSALLLWSDTQSGHADPSGVYRKLLTSRPLARSTLYRQTRPSRSTKGYPLNQKLGRLTLAERAPRFPNGLARRYRITCPRRPFPDPALYLKSHKNPAASRKRRLQIHHSRMDGRRRLQPGTVELLLGSSLVPRLDPQSLPPTTFSPRSIAPKARRPGERSCGQPMRQLRR